MVVAKAQSDEFFVLKGKLAPLIFALKKIGRKDNHSRLNQFIFKSPDFFFEPSASASRYAFHFT